MTNERIDVHLADFMLPFIGDDPTCDADLQCVEECPEPDPDCEAGSTSSSSVGSGAGARLSTSRRVRGARGRPRSGDASPQTCGGQLRLVAPRGRGADGAVRQKSKCPCALLAQFSKLCAPPYLTATAFAFEMFTLHAKSTALPR